MKKPKMSELKEDRLLRDTIFIVIITLLYFAFALATDFIQYGVTFDRFKDWNFWIDYGILLSGVIIFLFLYSKLGMKKSVKNDKFIKGIKDGLAYDYQILTFNELTSEFNKFNKEEDKVEKTEIYKSMLEHKLLNTKNEEEETKIQEFIDEIKKEDFNINKIKIDYEKTTIGMVFGDATKAKKNNPKKQDLNKEILDDNLFAIILSVVTTFIISIPTIQLLNDFTPDELWLYIIRMIVWSYRIYNSYDYGFTTLKESYKDTLLEKQSYVSKFFANMRNKGIEILLPNNKNNKLKKENVENE